MPTQASDIEKVKAKRQAAAEQISEGRGIEASAFTLGDSVMDAVRKDRASRGVSKIATDVGNVMGQMVTDPNRIKSHAGDVVNPLDVDAFTSQARARNLRTLGTIATQERQNQGAIDDVVQAGANTLQALAARKLAEAEKSRAEADALMEGLRYNMDVRKQDFYEYIQQEELNLAKQRLAASLSSKADAEKKKQDAKTERLEFTERLATWVDSAQKLGVLNDENSADFGDDMAGLAEEVASGDLSAQEAMQLLHKTYWPTGGVDITPTQEEIDAEIEKMYAQRKASGELGPVASWLKQQVENSQKYGTFGGGLSTQNIDAYIQSLPPEERKKAEELRKSSNL